MTELLSTELPDTLERDVRAFLEAACERELRLATAESCTGGMLASLLTDVEGSSHAFDRGFVVYTDEAKTAMLDVPAEMIAEHGAVSRPVAIAMAEGGLARSDADIALSVTGFAGPAGEENEEGLVHFACAREGRETIHREAHYGAIGRGPIRIECIKAAIEMMGEML
ncbi:MAG: CinA family protein [Parasphingopyxis sp.]|nr:CinA family protein [Sphingomonadales bacterium]